MKAKRDKQVEENYTKYLAHLDSEKTIDGPLDASSVNRNQHNFYTGSTEVKAAVSWGSSSAHCSIRRDNEFYYSITFQSDALDSRVLARLDAGMGTHYNRAPGIPQHLTSVPMPHYHEYRQDGYDVAHPLQGIDYSDESSTKFGCVQGFAYFCDRLHIKDSSGFDAAVICSPAGILPLDFECYNDPNDNIDFPE